MENLKKIITEANLNFPTTQQLADLLQGNIEDDADSYSTGE